MKIENEKKIAALEMKLPEISKSLASLRSDLSKAISNLNHIEIQSDNKTNKQKRDIIGSMFPENLCFDAHIHRTARTNDLAYNISLINSKLRYKKKRTKTDLSALSALVVRSARFSNHFFADVRRIADLDLSLDE